MKQIKWNFFGRWESDLKHKVTDAFLELEFSYSNVLFIRSKFENLKGAPNGNIYILTNVRTNLDFSLLNSKQFVFAYQEHFK